MTAMPAEHATLSATPPPLLRLVPAPSSAPPYDDEAAGAPVLRLVAAPVPLPAPAATSDDGWLVADRTPTAQLPAARDFAQTLLQALLEVLAGVRSIKQLQRDTTPEVYTDFGQRLRRRPHPSGSRPDRRAIRSVHVQARPEGIAEVCATVVRGGRLTALALRLEGIEGRWRCTELDGV